MAKQKPTDPEGFLHRKPTNVRIPCVARLGLHCPYFLFLWAALITYKPQNIMWSLLLTSVPPNCPFHGQWE